MLGLIGKKIGMTQIFDDSGNIIPVTIINIDNNIVLKKKTMEKDGYNAIVIGYGDVKPQRLTKPVLGQFKNTTPKEHIFEMRDFEKECNNGDALGVEVFSTTKWVDVIGTSKGKGFQGVVKKFGFKGGRKTHGSKFHRVGGSIGQSATPSRVLKGTRMASRLGGTTFTAQSLRVVKIDQENKLLLVRGAVPGRKTGIVIIKQAKKK